MTLGDSRLYRWKNLETKVTLLKSTEVWGATSVACANACKDQSKTAEKNGALAARYQQQCISHALRNEILWFQLARPPNTKLAATTFFSCAEMESMNRFTFTFTFQLSPQYKHYGYQRLNTIAFVKRMKHPLSTQITSASFQLIRIHASAM